MKKLLYISAVILFLGLLISGVSTSRPVLADTGTDDMIFKSCDTGSDSLHASGNDFCKNVNANKSFELIGPSGIITKIAQIIVWLVGIVSVLMIVLGGFRYAVSGGDPSGINGAKNSIIYACVGLAIAIFAQVIVSFVLSNL